VKVLAIDPGSEKGLGYALIDSTDLSLLGSGTIFIKRHKVNKVQDRVAVWRGLLDVLNHWGPHADVLAYEEVASHSSVWAAHLYGGQIAHIQWWGTLNEKGLQPVPVMTVKRFLDSKASGKAKAVAQVQAAHRLGYHTIKDHNEADALGIGLGAIWLLTNAQSKSPN
jgi:Holliday junction resolvasome RuvABC endonuclease subunit